MDAHKGILLIPIHKSLNTQKAVVEAMKRARPWQTSIHLVHLMHSWNPFIMINPASAFERTLCDDLDAYLKALLQLMHWKDLIEKNCPGVSVRIHVKTGFSWQDLMLQTARKVGPGTIILASSRKRQWLSIRNFISIRLLSLKTGCRVYSLKADATSGLTENSEIQSMPSTNKIPAAGHKRLSVFFSNASFHPLSHN